MGLTNDFLPVPLKFSTLCAFTLQPGTIAELNCSNFSKNLLGDQSDLFTGALFNGYGAPNGFCFDILCGDDPIIDNPDLPDYNVPDRTKSFATFLNQQKTFFRTNNIILTMGSDFQYQDAAINYKNMDKLIK